MITPPPFTDYYISGIWTDHTGAVSHYWVHQHLNPGISGGKKFSKLELLILMEKTEKPFFVIGWDYKTGAFLRGDRVIVYEGHSGRMLWTAKKEDRTKNLKHLIKISWFEEIKTIS